MVLDFYYQNAVATVCAIFLIGNPNMYGTDAEGQSTESSSRRADIPGDDEGMVIKRQALAYPYGSFYPGYMMAHEVNPLYHYAPINYVRFPNLLFFLLLDQQPK